MSTMISGYSLTHEAQAVRPMRLVSGPAQRGSCARRERGLVRKGLAQNPSDCLRPRRPWLRLLRDPSVEGRLVLMIKTQADSLPNAGLRTPAASFFAIRY